MTGFDFYFEAFAELSTTRAIGMTIGPIPFTAIVEYSKIYELEDLEDFAYVIRIMDNTFLELNAPEMEKPDNPEGGKKSANANTNSKNINKNRHGR